MDSDDDIRFEDEVDGGDDEGAVKVETKVVYEIDPALERQLRVSREHIKRLEADVAQVRERFTQANQDLESYRKRLDKEKTDIMSYGNEKILKELLPIIDTFEFALEAADHSKSDDFVSGVRMVYTQVLQTLKRFGLEPFDSLGEEFDPNIHQAVSHQDSDEYAPNHVVMVAQRGYFFHERLLRPALVTVAKGLERENDLAQDATDDSPAEPAENDTADVADAAEAGAVKADEPIEAVEADANTDAGNTTLWHRAVPWFARRIRQW